MKQHIGKFGRVWEKHVEEARQVRREEWEKALVVSKGNILRAAASLNIARSYGMKLTKQYGLTERARELRLQNGAPARGRPPSKVEQ